MARSARVSGVWPAVDGSWQPAQCRRYSAVPVCWGTRAGVRDRTEASSRESRSTFPITPFPGPDFQRGKVEPEGRGRPAQSFTYSGLRFLADWPHRPACRFWLRAEETALRAILICPNKELGEVFQASLQKVGGVEVVRNVARYPQPSEVGRILRSAGQAVVLVDLTSLEEALAVAKAVEVHAPGTPVAAVHDTCEPALVLTVMRAGLREFLYPPFPQPELREALLRLQALAEQTPKRPQTTDQVYTFLPAKPGVGTSTVALNFSLALSEAASSPVLLIDFDLTSGLIGFLLKLDNQYSTTHAVENSSKLDDNLWPHLVSRVGKLDVIPSGRINVGFRIEPSQLSNLLDYARRNYQAVCADLSGNLEKFSIELMQESKRIFLVTTPELPPLHLAREKLNFLRSADLEDRVSILLNRNSRRAAVNEAEVEKLLGASLYMTLPNDYQNVQKAVLEGRPVDSNSELGRCFQRLARSVLPAAEPPAKRRFVEYFSLTPARYWQGKKNAESS